MFSELRSRDGWPDEETPSSQGRFGVQRCDAAPQNATAQEIMMPNTTHAGDPIPGPTQGVASGPESATSADVGELDLGVDPRLLEILICPVSRGALTYDRDANELISKTAGLAFPIRNGVPIMLRDEARDLDEPQARAAK